MHQYSRPRKRKASSDKDFLFNEFTKPLYDPVNMHEKAAPSSSSASCSFSASSTGKPNLSDRDAFYKAFTEPLPENVHGKVDKSFFLARFNGLDQKIEDCDADMLSLGVSADDNGGMDNSDNDDDDDDREEDDDDEEEDDREDDREDDDDDDEEDVERIQYDGDSDEDVEDVHFPATTSTTSGTAAKTTSGGSTGSEGLKQVVFGRSFYSLYEFSEVHACSKNCPLGGSCLKSALVSEYASLCCSFWGGAGFPAPKNKERSGKLEKLLRGATTVYPSNQLVFVIPVTSRIVCEGTILRMLGLVSPRGDVNKPLE
jgi:hypothetical protein